MKISINLKYLTKNFQKLPSVFWDEISQTALLCVSYALEPWRIKDRSANYTMLALPDQSQSFLFKISHD